MKKQVTIVDSLPGSGKTEWAIGYMKLNPSFRWMFITPYLDELKRVQRSAPELKFADPQVVNGTKLNSLKDLITSGRNICSTHALFTHLDRETLDLIEAGGYRLIMDECVTVIEDRKHSGTEIAAMFDTGILKVEPGDNPVKQVLPGSESRLTKYRDDYQFAQQGRLVLIDGICLAWSFPPDTFHAFREVFNLGYAFEGQQVNAFFQIHKDKFDPIKKSVVKDGDGYKLVPFEENHNVMGLLRLAPRFDIYEGERNQSDTGPGLRGWGMYSSTWSKNPDNLKAAAGNLWSWICEENVRTRDFIWTAYKLAKKVSDSPAILRYSKGLRRDFHKSFLSINARATNSYRDRHVAAYLGNIHLNPYVKKYFIAMGVELDEAVYALSELLQWLFRSAIRQGEGVRVFIPSYRMRSLLKKWLWFPKAEVTIWPVKAEDDLETAGEVKAAA
jgi:hypothetical protein